MRRRDAFGHGGFASLIAIVISMLIMFALLASYLRSSTSTGTKAGPVQTLDAVKQKANAFEEQQRHHMEDLQREVAQ
jgi:hypothetical protein